MLYDALRPINGRGLLRREVFRDFGGRPRWWDSASRRVRTARGGRPFFRAWRERRPGSNALSKGPGGDERLPQIALRLPAPGLTEPARRPADTWPARTRGSSIRRPGTALRRLGIAPGLRAIRLC